MRSTALLFTLCLSAPALAQTPDWHETRGGAYLCGGVGQGSFAAIRAQRDQADVELLLTYGTRGGYLADVTVTVGGATLDAPLIIPKEGPLCLLRLPPGRYTLSAEYAGQTLERELKVGTTPSRVHLNFRAHEPTD